MSKQEQRNDTVGNIILASLVGAGLFVFSEYVFLVYITVLFLIWLIGWCNLNG